MENILIDEKTMDYIMKNDGIITIEKVSTGSC